MTMIRELKIETIDGAITLTCRPAPVYDELLGSELADVGKIQFNIPTLVGGGLSSSRIQVDLDVGEADEIGIELANSKNQKNPALATESQKLFSTLIGVIVAMRILLRVSRVYMWLM